MNSQPAALLAFYVALLACAAFAVALARARPGMITGLAAGVFLSELVVVPWAFTASLTIARPAPPLHLTWHDVPGSYARLAEGPTGNAGDLGTVVIAITVLCLLLARHRKRRLAAGAAPAALSVPPAAPHPVPLPDRPPPPARAHSRAGRARDPQDGEA